MRELRLVRVRVNISKISIAVKFPCSLKVHLRSDVDSVSTTGVYQLKQGVCQVNERLQLDVEAVYDSESTSYSQIGISLATTIASTNSNIPAGVISFNPFLHSQDQQVQMIETLQKCSDRDAKIYFTQSWQDIKKIKDLDSEFKIFKTYSQSRPLNKTTSSYSKLQQKEDIYKSTEKEKQINPTLLTESKVKAFHNSSTKIANGHESSIGKHRLNIAYSSYNTENSQRRENALKSQIQVLNLEVEKYKQKCRNYDRRERQLNMTIKDLRDNVQKKKSKVLESQSVKSQVELSLNEKQKQLKQAKLQKIKVQQKMEDMKLVLTTMERKIEIKEKAFEEEARLYSEKITQLEKDISKKTFEFNSLLEKMELAQRTAQLNMKDKEKRFLEDKTTYLKKIEILSQQLQKSKELNDEKEQKIIALTQSNKHLSTQESSTRNQLNRLQSEYEVLRAELSNQKNLKNTLEKQLHLLSSAESDKNVFKKKYNETFQQLTRTNQKLDRLQSTHNQLSAKFNETDEKLKESTKLVKQLNLQLNQITGEYETLKKDNSNLSNDFNSLSAKNLNLTQKLNDSKSKLEAGKQQFQEMQAHYQQKINHILKAKEYIQTELDDNKEKYTKQSTMLKDIESKYKKLNELHLSEHERTLKLQQSYNFSHEKIQEYSKKIELLTTEIQAWERKQKILLESLKSKGNDTYELQRKIAELDQELFLLEQKIQSQTKEWNAKQYQYEKHQAEKDKTINQHQNTIAEFKLDLARLQDELNKVMTELANKRKDLMIAEDNIKQHLQTIEKKNKKSEQLYKELQTTSQRAINLEEQLEKTQRIAKDFQNANKSIEDSWSLYRQLTSKALEQLIDQLSQDESFTTVELLKFPDNSLSSMQINSIKSRNETISKYKSTIFNLEEQLEVYKKEIQKNKLLTAKREEDLDQQINQLKTKSTIQHHEWMVQKQKFVKTISSLEQDKQLLISEIQKQKSTQMRLEEINSELQQQKYLLEQTLHQKEEEALTLTEKILIVKSQNILDRNLNDSTIKELNDQFQAHLDKFKETISETSNKLLHEQKEKLQKEKTILELQASREQVSLELIRESNKRTEFEQRLKQTEKDKEQLKTQLNLRENHIKDLKTEIQSNNHQIHSLEEKHLILQNERKQLYEQLTDTQVLKQKLQKALHLQKENSTNLKNQLDELFTISTSTSEQSTQKLKEQKDAITKLQYEIQLKSYVLQQLEKFKFEQETDIKELHKDIETKKLLLVQAGQQIETLKNTILKVTQNQSHLSIELKALHEENNANIDKITELQNLLLQSEPKAQQLIVRIQEIEQLKKKIADLEEQLHKASLQILASQSEVKNLTMRMNNDEQKYRKKILTLQTEIAQKQQQLRDNQAKIISEFERQKANLMKELEEQDKLMREREQQANFRNEQLQNQIQSLNQDCLELSNLLNDKEEEIISLQNQNQECERKISDLNGELKSCLEAWDKEKAAYLPSRKQMNELQSQMGKFQEYATELDSKTKQLIEISKKKGTEESKFGVTDLLRDLSSTLSKSKVKILNKVESEQEKQTILGQYKLIQDKIDIAMRSQNSIYK